MQVFYENFEEKFTKFLFLKKLSQDVVMINMVHTREIVCQFILSKKNLLLSSVSFVSSINYVHYCTYYKYNKCHSSEYPRVYSFEKVYFFKKFICEIPPTHKEKVYWEKKKYFMTFERLYKQIHSNDKKRYCINISCKPHIVAPFCRVLSKISRIIKRFVIVFLYYICIKLRCQIQK